MSELELYSQVKMLRERNDLLVDRIEKLHKVIMDARNQKPFAWAWRHASGSVEPVLFLSELDAIAECHPKSADGDAFCLYLHAVPSKEESITDAAAKKIWAHGFDRGHNEGIGCGHAMAPRCRHDADKEADDYSDEIREIFGSSVK
jgi:hypothetical protein